MRDNIYECCRELRLSTTFAENTVSAIGSTHQEYMLNVLQSEIEYRSNS